jgi:predicted GIY-YIG superfamily endonuclease
MGAKIMTLPIIKEHNVETGQIIEREYNASELAQYEAKLAEQAATEAEQAAKAEQRAALLERLGITEDEAKLLLG